MSQKIRRMNIAWMKIEPENFFIRDTLSGGKKADGSDRFPMVQIAYRYTDPKTKLVSEVEPYIQSPVFKCWGFKPCTVFSSNAVVEGEYYSYVRLRASDPLQKAFVDKLNAISKHLVDLLAESNLPVVFDKKGQRKSRAAIAMGFGENEDELISLDAKNAEPSYIWKTYIKVKNHKFIRLVPSKNQIPGNPVNLDPVEIEDTQGFIDSQVKHQYSTQFRIGIFVKGGVFNWMRPLVGAYFITRDMDEYVKTITHSIDASELGEFTIKDEPDDGRPRFVSDMPNTIGDRIARPGSGRRDEGSGRSDEGSGGERIVRPGSGGRSDQGGRRDEGSGERRDGGDRIVRPGSGRRDERRDEGERSRGYVKDTASKYQSSFSDMSSGLPARRGPMFN